MIDSSGSLSRGCSRRASVKVGHKEKAASFGQQPHVITSEMELAPQSLASPTPSALIANIASASGRQGES